MRRRATTSGSSGWSAEGTIGLAGPRCIKKKVSVTTAKTMAVAARRRRASHGPMSAFRAVAVEQAVGRDAPGPHQRPPRIGADRHAGHAIVHAGEVVGRVEPNARRVLI